MEDSFGTTYYDYDPLNQLEKVTNPDDSKVEYDYDPVGNRKEMKVTAGNIVTRTNYQYNEVNELTKFNVNDGAFTDFRYDANGNRTTMIQPDNRITSYSYDFENRLTKVQLHQDKWVGFEYDGDGNRITKLAAMTQPWHDNSKGNDIGFVPPGQEKVKKQQAELVFKLMGKDSGGGGGGNGGGSGGNGGNNGNAGDNNQGNGKDKNGNIGKGTDKLKHKEISKEEREKKKEQAKAKKGYREKGKHTNRGKHLGWYKNGKLTDQVVITNYVNDVSDPLTQVLMTYGEDGKYDAAYTYGLERIVVEALDETRPEAQDPLYYLYDGLGSVAYMVKPDSNKRDHYRYDAYGDTANGSKLSPDGKNVNHNTFGYTGELWDEESNLLYLRARYYEPSTGRFLSRDSYEGELTNPLSRNLYTYVENNPVNRVDPSGHEYENITLYDPKEDLEEFRNLAIEFRKNYDIKVFSKLVAKDMVIRYRYSLANLQVDLYNNFGILPKETEIAVEYASSEAFIRYASISLKYMGKFAKYLKFTKGTGKLSGKWIKANESMSTASRAYQKFITGTDRVWLQKGVKFDGMINGTLIEAKGSYASFVNKKTGQFYSWFNGADGLVSQARRQIAASEGASINWYFADQASLNATKALFKNEGISGVNLIFKPLK